VEDNHVMIKVAVTVAFLALNVYVYHFMAHQAVIPPRDSFASFPMQIEDWSCARNEPIDPAIKKNLGATDTLICTYVRSDHATSMGLYIGYHATQIREEGGGAGENSIHPPAHCLPGSGWDIIASRTVPLAVEGSVDPNGQAKRLIIAKGEERQLVYYWYQMQGRAIAEDWKKILYVGYDRATTGRTDGALVRFTIPVSRGDEAEADRVFSQLAPHVLKNLSRYVPV
jgi:EpsI family protein